MRVKLKPISEQVVVLLGASKGIGREAALQFAKKGARVVVAARGAEDLNSLVTEIRMAGGIARAVPTDATDYLAVQALAAQAVEAYGRIDTWVNLPAVSVYATFDQTTLDEFEQIMDVTFMGQVHGAKAALPYLKREGGSLICITSADAVRSVPYHSAYAAAKHAVKGFVDSLRVELEHEGAPVNLVNIMPTSINTPFFETARTKLGVQPKGIPPVYEPEVAARVILFAAEHSARDLYVGGAAKFFTIFNNVAPRVTDRFLRLAGFASQRTQIPKSADAPHSLYAPIDGSGKVHGSQGAEARSWSIYAWLQTHPEVRMAATGTIVIALTFLASRKVFGQHE